MTEKENKQDMVIISGQIPKGLQNAIDKWLEVGSIDINYSDFIRNAAIYYLESKAQFTLDGEVKKRVEQLKEGEE